MIATVTNTSGASLDIPAPFNRTLANGANFQLGVNLADLNARSETGNPHWKVLNDLIKKGKITIAYADDAQTSDTYDKARNA